MKIQLYALSREEPPPITTDSKGNPISLRSRVAYNMSGNIETGYIDSIERNGWKKPTPINRWKILVEPRF